MHAKSHHPKETPSNFGKVHGLNELKLRPLHWLTTLEVVPKSLGCCPGAVIFRQLI